MGLFINQKYKQRGKERRTTRIKPWYFIEQQMVDMLSKEIAKEIAKTIDEQIIKQSINEPMQDVKSENI